jgi:4'-phosphopantetheinyl transferase
MLGTDGDEVYLWLAFPDQIRDHRLLVAYESILTDDEREKRARFHFESDRHRYLITRILVRTVLSRYAVVEPRDWIFATNDFGRPYIANLPRARPGLSFNISHTKDLILMAVTDGAAIGVDVENFGSRDLPVGIADRHFAPDEVAALHSLPTAEQKRRFFDLWTLKESYIKARGMGVSISLDGFSFCFQAERTIAFSTRAILNDNSARWKFWQFEPALGFSAAVCGERVTHARPTLKFMSTIPLDGDTPMDVALLRTSVA